MKLSSYLQLPLDTRRQHLRPEAPCKGTERLSQQRLLSALGLDNDIPNWKVGKVSVACVCRGCQNPEHSYLCRSGEVRDERKALLEKRVAPYLHSPLSHRQVAAKTGASSATVAKLRREAGVDTTLAVGADGKTYTRGTEAKAQKQLVQALETATRLLTADRCTEQVRELLAALEAAARAAKDSEVATPR